MRQRAQRAVEFLMPFVAGVIVTWAFYNRPQSPDEFIVTLKEACVPKDGVTLKLSYSGRGDAYFLVRPPQTTEKVEKEKKQ